MAPSHGTRSYSRGIEHWTLVALIGLALLSIIVTFFIIPPLLPLVLLVVLVALGVEAFAHADEGRLVVGEAIQDGAPQPITAWGKIANVAGACEEEAILQKGLTFVVANGRVWPALCQHAERAILDAAGRMDTNRELTETPVSFQDTSHRIELELYRVPEKYRAQAPTGWRPAPDSRSASLASLGDGRVEDSTVGIPRNWLPRAMISAFMSTILMSIIFFVAFAFARIGATLIPDAGPASVLHDWLVALTTNSVLDLAASSLYVAGALHIVIGTVWGLIYAVAFEPRLSGPSWLKGAAFGLLPWALSLLVFLPLVGGGVFGAAIGAGPLPALGNLILHLVYGVSLGALYGPLGEIPADEFPRMTASNTAWETNDEEAAMAKGVIGGAAVGGVLGIMGALVASASPSGSLYGAEPMAILAVSIVLGAAFGLFAGSIAGLESTGARRIH